MQWTRWKNVCIAFLVIPFLKRKANWIKKAVGQIVRNVVSTTKGSRYQQMFSRNTRTSFQNVQDIFKVNQPYEKLDFFGGYFFSHTQNKTPSHLDLPWPIRSCILHVIFKPLIQNSLIKFQTLKWTYLDPLGSWRPRFDR